MKKWATTPIKHYIVSLYFYSKILSENQVNAKKHELVLVLAENSSCAQEMAITLGKSLEYDYLGTGGIYCHWFFDRVNSVELLDLSNLETGLLLYCEVNCEY